MKSVLVYLLIAIAIVVAIWATMLLSADEQPPPEGSPVLTAGVPSRSEMAEPRSIA